MSEVSFRQLVDNAGSIDDVVDVLMSGSSKNSIRDTASDAILVDFFSRLSDFDKRVDIDEEDIELFKKEFDFESIGIDRTKAQQAIKKMRSIDRIVDTLIDLMPQEILEDLARDHIRKIWFEQNVKGDLEAFKNSLNYKWWIN